MTTLTKEEKIQIIESRSRGLEYKRYGLEVDLIVENAKESPDQNALDSINDAISQIDSQLNALSTELVAVQSAE